MPGRNGGPEGSGHPNHGFGGGRVPGGYYVPMSHPKGQVGHGGKADYAGAAPGAGKDDYIPFGEVIGNIKFGLQKYKNPLTGVLYGFFLPVIDVKNSTTKYIEECQIKRDFELLEENLTLENFGIVERNIELIKNEKTRELYEKKLSVMKAKYLANNNDTTLKRTR